MNKKKMIVALLKKINMFAHNALTTLQPYQNEREKVIYEISNEIYHLTRKCLNTLEKDCNNIIDLPILNRSLFERTIEVIFICVDEKNLSSFQLKSFQEHLKHLKHAKNEGNYFYQNAPSEINTLIQVYEGKVKSLKDLKTKTYHIEEKLKIIQNHELYSIYQHYCNITHPNFLFINHLKRDDLFNAAILDYIKQTACYTFFTHLELSHTLPSYEKKFFEKMEVIFIEMWELIHEKKWARNHTSD